MRRAPTLLALLLTLPTGATGLIYEVTWQRYLATLLGSQAASVALVLGVFLGSLALGYALLGRLAQAISRRSAADAGPRRLLACYAGAEAAIGAYAVVFPSVFEALRGQVLGRPADALSPVLDVAATLILVAPPTLLMGATIPLLTQALPRSLEQATRIHAWVYGLNTLGAVAGALGAGFVLIPALGLDATMKLAGTVNQAAAVAYAFLALLAASGSTPARAPVPAERSAATPPGMLLGALLLGAGMMTLQVVANRIGALSLGASVFTFAMVAAVFVLCIALGSLGVSVSSRWPTRVVAAVPWLLAVSVLALHPVVDDAPYWAHRLRVRFGFEDAEFIAFHAALLVALLVPLGVPALLSGAALPLLFHELRRRHGELGRLAGRLYAWNTLGSLLGACGLGYLALHWLDLDGVYRLAAAALVVAAAILHAALAPQRRWLHVAVAASLLAGLALLPGWEAERLASGLFRTRSVLPETHAGPAAFFAARAGLARLVFYADGPDTSVAVGERPRPEGRLDRNIVVNGKSDGLLIGEYRTRAMSALLPALFARDLERAFVVGYGTGVTAAELAALEPGPRVDVAEISREVLRAAPFFDYANLGAGSNPAIAVRHADAFRALTRSPERYDVIVSEPSNPWVAGTERLYSREFLALGRETLRPGGVFAQWIHTYELDAATLELVLRTFAAVFEHAAVWYTDSADLLLLGTRDPQALVDLERLRRRVARADFQAGLRRAGVRGLPGLLAHELLPEGLVRDLEPGPLHTLGRPLLGDRAARAFFRNDTAHLPSLLGPRTIRRGSGTSLLGQARRALGDPDDPAFWRPLLHEACALRPAQCATLLAGRRAAGDRSPAWAELVDQLRTRPELEPFLGEDTLARLEALFAADAGFAAGALSVEELRRRSQLYAGGFVYGAPFRREALASQWERCRPLPACRESRRQAEGVLGALSP